MKLLLASFFGGLTAVTCVGQNISSGPSLAPRIRSVEYRTQAQLSRDVKHDTARMLRNNVNEPNTPLDAMEVREIAVDYARGLLWDEGYWRASVKTKLVPIYKYKGAQWFDVVFEIDEGVQYSLSGVAWTGMKEFGEADLDRSMAIHPGEVASRRRIANGLQAARELYVARGYVNCFLTPNTKIDDTTHTLTLEIAVDEGGQFHFGDLSLPGLDDARREMLSQRWQIIRGTAYSPGKEEEFFRSVLTLADPKLRGYHYWFYREFIKADFDQSQRTVNFSIRFAPPPPIGDIY